MRSSNSDIAMQGIEFWTSVCDEEIDLDMAMAEVWLHAPLIVQLRSMQSSPDQRPSVYSQHYAKGALAHLVPLICELITKQVCTT